MSAVQTYRVIFVLAAVYNLAFGLWAAVSPLSYFEWFDLPMPRYPSIWACLGMVVGLYGPVYLLIAREPERGSELALIGLIGKMLGPIGWVWTVWQGVELPPRTFPLILANDLIWWFPFLFYLLRNSRHRGRIITGVCVVIHLMASLLLLACGGGSEMTADFAARQQWILAHTGLWVCTWVSWVLASLSLLAFCVAWSQHLRKAGAAASWLAVGCGVIAIGLVGDLYGEWVNIARITNPNLSVDDFVRGTRTYTLVSAAYANGMYCLGGLLLSAVAWRSGSLRGPAGITGFAMWSVGLILTAAAVLDSRLLLVVCGAAVMGLFIPWSAWVGRRFSS
jgi:hypothetical protein